MIAGSGGAQPPQPVAADARPLPKGLWIGTAVFAVLAAAALFAALRLGRERSESSARETIELKPVEVSDQLLNRIREEAAVPPQLETPAPAAAPGAAPPPRATRAKAKRSGKRRRRAS